MNRILIIGATSTIAQETIHRFAESGAALFLVGRNADKLKTVAHDARVRGIGAVSTYELDVNDFDRHTDMLREADEFLGGLDAVLIAYGTLPDQDQCERDVDVAMEALTTNALSVIALLTPIVNRFEAQGQGCIAVISSVAGDRGRRTNYVYGSAKAAVSVFMGGLRHRLAHTNVTVVTLKPGLVDTPMTAHLPKTRLWSSPRRVGRGVYAAMQKGVNVKYLPGYWRGIMLIVRSIPDAIFKHLSI